MCPLNVHMCACAVLRHHCKEKCKTYIQNVDIRYVCVDILNCMFYILNVIFEFQDSSRLFIMYFVFSQLCTNYVQIVLSMKNQKHLLRVGWYVFRGHAYGRLGSPLHREGGLCLLYV
jgi:hypothetical protein